MYFLLQICGQGCLLDYYHIIKKGLGGFKELDSFGTAAEFIYDYLDFFVLLLF